MSDFKKILNEAINVNYEKVNKNSKIKEFINFGPVVLNPNNTKKLKINNKKTSHLK